MKEKNPKKAKKKKKKIIYVDDGHTVYDMDGVGGAKHYEKDDGAHLTKKEKRAAIRAAFAAYLPKFLIVLLGFSIAAVLLYLWLK